MELDASDPVVAALREEQRKVIGEELQRLIQRQLEIKARLDELVDAYPELKAYKGR